MPFNLDSLPESIGHIFDQTQATASNHRKNCAALYKLHKQSASVTSPARNGQSVKLLGEKTFSDTFQSMLTRVMNMKKGVGPADRIVRFAGSYVKFMSDKESESEEETTFSRFIARVLKWLLGGFEAKDKNVRFRSLQLVSELISHLGEIDEDTYAMLRQVLLDRLQDKEPTIRAMAVLSLYKLVGSSDLADCDEDDKAVLHTLFDCMSNDPAVEVRRCALVNIPLSSDTLDYIMDRAKDVDTLTRKLLYTRVLSHKLKHPRQLTIAQREQIVREGLGDREPAVRIAAGKLMAAWFDVFHSDDKAVVEWKGDDAGNMHALARLLYAFDLVGPGVEVAADALNAIFVTRPGLVDSIIFEDDFWNELTAEAAVLARVFIQHCRDNNLESILESAKVPVVTAFAFYVQKSYNKLLQCLQDHDLQEAEDEDTDSNVFQDAVYAHETVLGELLRISVTLDYADEIGRRKMFTIVRDMISQDTFPPSLIEPAMDVLYEITPNERDLILVVVELVVALMDDDEGEEAAPEPEVDESQADISRVERIRTRKPREEMSSDEAARKDEVDMRCLLICIAMLEKLKGTLDDNSMLEGIVASLIVPAVRRKDAVMREKGLTSLALYCLVAKRMAIHSFQLFLNQVQGAPHELRSKVLQMVFDIFVIYGNCDEFAKQGLPAQIIDFLVQTLRAEVSESVLATLSIGLSKLLLAGVAEDSAEVLKSLLNTYFDPVTHENQSLRQCLSYFFPAYCFAWPENQSLMRSIFTDFMQEVIQVYTDKEEDEEMITPYQIGLQIIDWIDPQKSFNPTGSSAVNQAHSDLAVDILAELYNPERDEEYKKVLCQLLSQIQIREQTEDKSIFKIDLLLSNLDQEDIMEDLASAKLVNKFKTKFKGNFGSRLDELDVQQLMDDDLRNLYLVIDLEPPEIVQRENQDVMSKPQEKEVAAEEEDEEEDDDEDHGPAEDTEQEDAAAVEETILPEPDSEMEEPPLAESNNSEEEEEEKEEEEEEEEEPPREPSPTPPSKTRTGRQPRGKQRGKSPDPPRVTTPPPKKTTANGTKRLRSPTGNKVLPSSPAGRKRTRRSGSPTPKMKNGTKSTQEKTGRATRGNKVVAKAREPSVESPVSDDVFSSP